VTIKELRTAALQLSPEERAELASELLLSLDDLTEAEVERLWIEEAQRRDAQIDAGIVKLIPGDEAIAEARSRLK
jgi:hypothetical protein